MLSSLIADFAGHKPPFAIPASLSAVQLIGHGYLDAGAVDDFDCQTDLHLSIARYRVELDRVSFIGTVDALRQYTQTMAQARSRQKQQELWDDLLSSLARDLVPSRPRRREPQE